MSDARFRQWRELTDKVEEGVIPREALTAVLKNPFGVAKPVYLENLAGEIRKIAAREPDKLKRAETLIALAEITSKETDLGMARILLNDSHGIVAAPAWLDLYRLSKKTLDLANFLSCAGGYEKFNLRDKIQFFQLKQENADILANIKDNYIRPDDLRKEILRVKDAEERAEYLIEFSGATKCLNDFMQALVVIAEIPKNNSSNEPRLLYEVVAGMTSAGWVALAEEVISKIKEISWKNSSCFSIIEAWLKINKIGHAKIVWELMEEEPSHEKQKVAIIISLNGGGNGLAEFPDWRSIAVGSEEIMLLLIDAVVDDTVITLAFKCELAMRAKVLAKMGQKNRNCRSFDCAIKIVSEEMAKRYDQIKAMLEVAKIIKETE
jgi:hypothetical protein